ncbi:hypothetical protein S83_051292 [Arachis hypogaea]
MLVLLPDCALSDSSISCNGVSYCRSKKRNFNNTMHLRCLKKCLTELYVTIYLIKMMRSNQKVAVDGIWKVCPRAGGPIQFPGFNREYYHSVCLHIDVRFPLH